MTRGLFVFAHPEEPVMTACLSLEEVRHNIDRLDRLLVPAPLHPPQP